FLISGLLENYVICGSVRNVSADHLGDYCIETVAELAEAKSIVLRALVQGSHGIINNYKSNIKERFDNLSCAKIVVTQ
ncbi:Mur ligase, partial [Francisella tularensis subsp. holarctica]|nr:Mur ligase [Francisella tularensis subsp. holarctica]